MSLAPVFIPVFIFSFSLSAIAQTADDIWESCSHEQTELCRQRAGVSANITPRGCAEDIAEYCKLTVKRACAEKNGGISGCSRFGISETFANYPGNLPSAERFEEGEVCIKGVCPPKPNPQAGGAKPKANPSASQSRTPSSSQPTPQNTTPQVASTAQSEASSDLSSCQNLAREAISQCTSKGSGLNQSGPKEGQGIADYCAQMKTANNAGINANDSSGTACYNKRRPCETTCGNLVTKYKTLVANCNGTCESANIYQTTQQQLESASNQCTKLKSVESSLFGDAQSLSGDNSYASLCNQLASSMNPQSTGDMSGQSQNPASTNANDPFGCQANPQSQQCIVCSQNPTNQACQALAKASETQSGQAGYVSSDASKSSSSNMNVADNSSVSNPDPYLGGGAKNDNGVKVTPIGGGGGAGGGGFGGSGATPPASLGGGPQQRRGPAPSSNVGDIDQGFRSGGYSAPVGDDGSSNGQQVNGYGFGGRKFASVDEHGKAVDLKQYLPGGAMAPASVGGNRPYGNQIHGKFVDIWNRISVRMTEKCKLGKLAGCE